MLESEKRATKLRVLITGHYKSLGAIINGTPACSTPPNSVSEGIYVLLLIQDGGAQRSCLLYVVANQTNLIIFSPVGGDFYLLFCECVRVAVLVFRIFPCVPTALADQVM